MSLIATLPRGASAAAQQLRATPWVQRYGPQHLAAGLATLAAAALLGYASAPSFAIALGTTAAESVVFYAVALLRDGRPGARLAVRVRALLHEYGVPEALDLVLRPALIAACLQATPTAVVAAAAGSWLADLSFYANASWRAGRTRAHR